VGNLENSQHKMTIENKFPKTPSEVIFSGMSFLKKWRSLLKETDRGKLWMLR
jgi:hypothetical protein